jgi:hypothetical protein
VSSINLGEHQGDGIRYSMHLSAPAGGAAQMLRDPAGNWVGYADYAALQAENERLRKAGDAMAASHLTLIKIFLRESSDEWHQQIHESWLAAKETRP